MTRDELLTKFRRWADMWGREQYDEEQVHLDADDALLAYINDPEITAAFSELHKWYA